jgi:hypothetical protein
LVKRQAGAELYSQIEAEVAALSLSGDQGISDFVAHSVDNAAHVLAAENLNAFDRYRKGKAAIYIRGHVGGADREFCLSFFRAPSSAERPVSRLERNVAIERDAGGVEVQRNEGAVFLGISNLVESPEGIIPSFVSLEPLKNRTDFRWQILASAGKIVAPFFFGGSERKLDGLEGRAFSSKGRCITSLVEDSAQIVSDVKEDAWQNLCASASPSSRLA